MYGSAVNKSSMHSPSSAVLLDAGKALELDAGTLDAGKALGLDAGALDGSKAGASPPRAYGSIATCT